MCVICLAKKRKPTPDEVEKMFKRNDHGAGIAWREGEEVVWEKGLSLEEIQTLAVEAPLPYVLHFRLQSCGGILKELCHPFPVSKGIGCELGGRTKGEVLFHNGHWDKWRENGLETIIKNKIKTPEGKWTDTRTMALLALLHGKAILDFINEKVLLFSPTKIDIWRPDLFTQVDDLLVSNRLWETGFYQVTDSRRHHGTVYYPGGRQYDDVDDFGSICQYSTCREESINGGRFCAQHQPACREKGCVVPRVGSSDYCAVHQPYCLEVGCPNRRIVGEKHCAHHIWLLNKDKDGQIGLKTPPLKVEGPVPLEAIPEVRVPGVAPVAGTITTFPRGVGTVQEGQDQQTAAPDHQEKLGAVSEGLPRPSLEPSTPLGRLLEARKWSISINPAALISSPIQTALAILEGRTRGCQSPEPLLM